MSGNQVKKQELTAKLGIILKRRGLPASKDLTATLGTAIDTLRSESLRPRSRGGYPGGLIRLPAGGYYIIVPDLHARMEFFLAALNWNGFSGRSVLDDMDDGMAQIICVGDAFHSESRGRERWRRALQEWMGGYKKHRNMDQEMRENLGLLEMISTVKSAYPDNFHFLKGNHENIANEQGEGNYAFRKYAYEGDMVKHWVNMFMGEETFNSIYAWEKALPLVAEGPDFLVCHSEPARPVSPDEVINAYDNPDVIYSLTWTDNDQAENGSAAVSLENFGKTGPGCRIFGGHRAVSGLFSERQGGRYIQINRPDRWVIAAFTDMNVFKPERDIICIDQGD